MERTTSTHDGSTLLKLGVGEKFPPDSDSFAHVIGQEKNGQWYRYKPTVSRWPVDPNTGLDLRRPDPKVKEHKMARDEKRQYDEDPKRSAGLAARRRARKRSRGNVWWQ